MLNKLKELRESREEGFTLIELLVVIVIIGVLAAIALPLLFNQQRSAIAAVVKSDVRNTVTAVRTYLVKNPDATTDELQVARNGANTPTFYNMPNDDVVPVITDRETTIVVSGDWKSYVVYGTNTNMPGGAGLYMYDSRTGKYGSSETSLYIEKGQSQY